MHAVKNKNLIMKPSHDPCNSNKSIKGENPNTHQNKLMARRLEGRGGVHSNDTLPQTFYIGLVRLRYH